MATKSPKQKPAEPPNQKPTDKGNAPALRGIFTAEQVTLLESYLPKYLLIKREPGKKFIDFWGPLLQDFFFNHPLADLTPEELASGVDQGNRVGERQAKVQKVCERISFVLFLWLTWLSADQRVVQQSHQNCNVRRWKAKAFGFGEEHQLENARTVPGVRSHEQEKHWPNHRQGVVRRYHVKTTYR